MMRTATRYQRNDGPNRNGSHEDHVMASKALPSPEVLRQLLRYVPETGKLFWRHRGVEWFHGEGRLEPSRVQSIWNLRYAESEAGHTQSGHKYTLLSVLNNRVYAHRVIWAMTYGNWPEFVIDHINGDGSDNRIINLRKASRSQNDMNRGEQRNNTSGMRGVSFNKKSGTWRARVKVKGVEKSLGYFKIKSDAEHAMLKYMRENFGDFMWGGYALEQAA